MTAKKSSKSGGSNRNVVRETREIYLVDVTTTDGAVNKQKVSPGTTVASLTPCGQQAFVNGVSVSPDTALKPGDKVMLVTPSAKAGK